LPILKGHSQASIGAICGRNRGRAEEMAVKFGIPSVYTDYADMIQEENLDAVVIAVPDDLHYPITMAALDAGLHVLCEKPMAFTLEQASQMLAKAEAMRVKHMVYFTWRWVPYFRLLHRLVSQGYIGRCYDAHFYYVGGYARGGEYQWKWDQQHGLGVLGDLGAHMIDQALLTVGEIARVHASLSVRVPKTHPEGKVFEAANDSATLTVQFKNGATGTIFTSAAVEAGDGPQRITLYGEKGTLDVVSNMNAWTVRGLQGKESEFQDIPIPDEFMRGSDPEPSFNQILQTFMVQSIGTRLFIDSIIADQPVTPGFYEGMKVQEVIEAAFESDRSGCWVDVS